MLDPKLTPRRIVEALDRYVIGQDDAKRTVAVAVYAHFRKIAQSSEDGVPITKSNVLMIGPSGTGKTLMCETLARILGVPFVTAEATSLAQTRYVNDEIEAILQRLVDKAGGDIDKRAARHRLHRRDRQAEGRARSRAPSPARASSTRCSRSWRARRSSLPDAQYVDTTNILFICGGAFVGLDDIMSQTHGFGFISTDNAGQQADPRPAQHAREADRSLHVRADPGVHRPAADHRALRRPVARNAGAHPDRAAAIRSTASSSRSSAMKASS